jgi:hypothetical protein
MASRSISGAVSDDGNATRIGSRENKPECLSVACVAKFDSRQCPFVTSQRFLRMHSPSKWYVDVLSKTGMFRALGKLY